MVYDWCKACKCRATKCIAPDSHRAQRKIVWRADFLLGGRYGKRMRPIFKPGIKKAEAINFQALAIADFQRGKYVPKAGIKSKTLFADFIKTYSAEYVQRHMRGADSEMYRLSHALKMWGHRPLNTVQYADGAAYVTTRLEQGAAKTTVNREITSLKIMFRWATDNDYVSTNPFVKLKKFKEETIRQRWLTDQEIEILIGGCRSLKDFDLEDLIVVAINCGFREANLRRLTAQNILGTRLSALKTKSGKDYDVPMSETLRERLDKLVRMRAPSPLLNFKNFRRRWAALTKFVGLWKAERDPNNVTLHTLRHTFVAQCLRRGIPLDVVCAWVGHHSIEFTRKHYGHLCKKKEDEYINQLNLGGNIDRRDEGASGQNVPQLSPSLERARGS